MASCRRDSNLCLHIASLRHIELMYTEERRRYILMYNFKPNVCCWGVDNQFQIILAFYGDRTGFFCVGMLEVFCPNIRESSELYHWHKETAKDECIWDTRTSNINIRFTQVVQSHSLAIL